MGGRVSVQAVLVMEHTGREKEARVGAWNGQHEERAVASGRARAGGELVRTACRTANRRSQELSLYNDPSLDRLSGMQRPLTRICPAVSCGGSQRICALCLSVQFASGPRSPLPAALVGYCCGSQPAMLNLPFAVRLFLFRLFPMRPSRPKKQYFTFTV